MFILVCLCMFTVYPPFGALICCGFHMTLQRIGFVCESCWGSCTTSFGRVMSVLCWEPIWRLSCKECFGKQSWITVGLPTSSYQNLCVLESRMPGSLEIFGNGFSGFILLLLFLQWRLLWTRLQPLAGHKDCMFPWSHGLLRSMHLEYLMMKRVMCKTQGRALQ